MHVVSAAVLERWNTLSDEQVVDQILAGQTAMFEVLMRRHNERLYRAARAILRDETEAEDVMQQAYVNAYAHLRQFDGRAEGRFPQQPADLRGPPRGAVGLLRQRRQALQQRPALLVAVALRQKQLPDALQPDQLVGKLVADER